MKLALNGALTLGTLDGANIEILEEVGKENIYIFGLTAEEVEHTMHNGYRPKDIYLANTELKLAIDMIQEGFFCPENPDVFHPIVDSLLNHGDRFMVLADFESYCNTHKKIEEEFRDTDLWTRKSIINSACMGRFSSDRDHFRICPGYLERQAAPGQAHCVTLSYIFIADLGGSVRMRSRALSLRPHRHSRPHAESCLYQSRSGPLVTNARAARRARSPLMARPRASCVPGSHAP